MIEKDRPLSMLESPDFYMRSPEEIARLFIHILRRLKIPSRSHPCATSPYLSENGFCRIIRLKRERTPASYLRKMVWDGAYEISKDDGSGNGNGSITSSTLSIPRAIRRISLSSRFRQLAKNNGIGSDPDADRLRGHYFVYPQHHRIDPLFFNLPFERFLNPFRPSPPISTLILLMIGVMKSSNTYTAVWLRTRSPRLSPSARWRARGAVRDAGRASGCAYAQPNRIFTNDSMDFRKCDDNR